MLHLISLRCFDLLFLHFFIKTILFILCRTLFLSLISSFITSLLYFSYISQLLFLLLSICCLCHYLLVYLSSFFISSRACLLLSKRMKCSSNHSLFLSSPLSTYLFIFLLIYRLCVYIDLSLFICISFTLFLLKRISWFDRYHSEYVRGEICKINDEKKKRKNCGNKKGKSGWLNSKGGRVRASAVNSANYFL